MKMKKKDEVKNMPIGTTDIRLTDEQELIVLENIIALWSPFGLANRYSMKILKGISKVFEASIKLKQNEQNKD